MSEHINIVPELMVEDEFVQSGESIESLSRNDKIDYINVADLNPENCTNILDTSESIDNSDGTNCLISIEKNTIANKEIDIENAEMSSDGDKLIDVNTENIITQMGMYMTNSDEPSKSVLNQANVIVNTENNVIEVDMVGETGELNSEEITDLSKADILQSISNDISTEIKEKEVIVLKETTSNENCSVSEEHLIENNVLNSEVYKEDKIQNESNENLLKLKSNSGEFQEKKIQNDSNKTNSDSEEYPEEYIQNDSSKTFLRRNSNSEKYQEDHIQNDPSEILLNTSLNSEVYQEDSIQYDLSETLLKTSSYSEEFQEDPIQNDTNETLIKTSSRPQRQAAKKAENQIREIAKEIIKPIDCVDEKIIEDKVEMLSSPLKKVCCQCNRFRLCKFTVKDHKSMYLCQEDCVASYRRKNGQLIFKKKCEQCLSLILESEDKSYSWQSKIFCSINCLSHYQNIVFDSNCKNCKNFLEDSDLGKYCRYISGKIYQFCGNICMENYENSLKLCNFCQKELIDSNNEEFCSSFCQTKDYESRKKHIDPDSTGDYVIKELAKVIDKCNVCFCKLSSSSLDDIQIFYTNTLFKFCSNECLNKFIMSKKRTVSCSSCKIKKFNFDMITTKNVSSISPTYICSLHCLHKQQELPQSKSKKIICDKCGLLSHIRCKTIINSFTYNFCSQNCLNLFQSSKKSKSKSKSKNEKTSSVPRATTRKSVHKEEYNLSDNDEGILNSQHKTTKTKNKVRRKISYENTNVTTTVDKEVQTDQTGSKGLVIPVPVPVYIPMPMHMYVMPYPVPVPIPIPLPIPIFIPTTKNTAKAILKDIKKIKDVTPDDPFEAELLLMAGMVADESKIGNNSLSDSEDDESNEYNDDKVVSSSARNHNTFGDDVLAIALNMAGADTESLGGVTNITPSNQANHIIDDVEANLVSSTIMPQTSDPVDNITQENMISSPQDMLCRPPRKRAPRTQSRGSNLKRSRKNEYQQDSCNQSSSGLMQQQQQQQLLVHNPLYSIPMPVVKPDANMCLKYTLGVNAWRQWASMKSIEFEKTLSSNVGGIKKTNIFNLDLLQLTASELNYCLCLFVKEVCKPNGSDYAPDTVYYLCLGVQQYLFENGRIDNIFTDIAYEQFTDNLNEIAKKFMEIYNDTKFIVTRVEEEYLWESKQLGAHSPYVLLCTLIFFNTKHFNLTNVEEHMQLSFSHIMKHWKRNPNQPSTSGVKAPGTYRNVLLRFYPPQASIDSPNSRKKKVYEQHENEENPLRCPVKLYEFYLSKCPESVKTRNDLFYLTPERSCVPDSPVWYSTCALNKNSLEKMLNRVKMVKEINIALLTT